MTHDTDCECFRCKVLTIQFNPKGPAPQTLMERRWDKDMPAYARLRADGIQPRAIDGSAHLEAKLSEGQAEADLDHLFNRETGFTKKDLSRVSESFEEAQAQPWRPGATE